MKTLRSIADESYPPTPDRFRAVLEIDGNFLTVECDKESVVSLGLGRRGTETPGTRPPLLQRAVSQIEEYFAGKRKVFDLPLTPAGSAFDRRVWRALQEVPYAETVTYGDLAAAIGRPGAARAVGGAVGRNPMPVLIPCHRVLAAGGRLGGFSCGLEWKRRLLRLETIEWQS